MNVQQFLDAIARLDAAGALQCHLDAEAWKALVPCLTTHFLRAGEPLMHEGDNDRQLYILAEGELDVSVQGHPIATLRPGAVVGEGTFFSGQPRSATVTPSTRGIAWGLHWDKIDLLARKQPMAAIALLKSLGNVLAVRMRQAVLVGHLE